MANARPYFSRNVKAGFASIFIALCLMLFAPVHSRCDTPPTTPDAPPAGNQQARFLPIAGDCETQLDEYDEDEVPGTDATCGVERWSVKTGTDADAGLVDLNSTTSTTVATLVAIPKPGSLPSNNRVAPTETTVYQIYATRTLYKLESDSDYHLVMDDGLGHTMITEIPSPACVGSSSPFIDWITHASAEFDAVLTATTSFQTANIPVRVTGVGFFDFAHGQTGLAPNCIELHPILDIVFNPSLAPPEVSGLGASVPFTMTPSGNGLQFKFQYLGTSNKYHLYGAPDQVTMDAGTWSFKACDLQHNAYGTWATDNSTYASWTLADASTLPAYKYVVVQEAAGVEGPYGYKSDGSALHQDLDRSTPTSIGCGTGCAPASASIVNVTPDTTVNQGTAQTFSGSGSGQGTLSYAWDFHYAGTFSQEATGQTTTYTYANTGAYQAALKVTDSCSSPGPQSAISTVAININPAGSCGPLPVISQVYGGGGNSGAYYKNDFIELFNRGDQIQDLSGWSVQYASATGTTWSVTALSGSIPAGGYYLVQEYQGSGGTASLPTPDATGSINMSATNGKVALVNTTTALSVACPTGTNIVDLFGYGTANCYEGTAAPALTNTTSASRALAGCTDTGNNASDFTAATSDASNPARNSATANHTCTCP